MLTALREQGVIPVADPENYEAVRSAIAAAFSATGIQGFLRSMQSAGLRIRDFELALAKGVLGASVEAEYYRLSGGDQGQIREFYLASLEQVSAELRARFFKLYAYY
jgi:hypothetical protein